MAARSVRVHPNAIAEARAAYRWYAERNLSAASGFMTELDLAVSEIEGNPERWPVHLHGTRKFLLRRFPYSVIYRITERELQVIAVAHGTPPSRILENPPILNQVSPYQGLLL